MSSFLKLESLFRYSISSCACYYVSVFPINHIRLETFKEVESRTEEKDQNRICIYKAALASEKNYFKQELNKDFRNIGQTFLWEQIQFYRQLADRLETLYDTMIAGQMFPETKKQVYQ